MKDIDKKPLFSRESSGFVRGFNLWDVFVFNMLGYATGLSLATNPTILGGLYPNADIYGTLIFGVIVSIFTGLLYGIFAGIFPSSGGDYIYNSRTISPLIGFVASWGFTWSQIYGIGTFAGWAIRDAISPSFITAGHLLGNLSFVTIGQNLSNTNNIFIGGIVILLICFISSLLTQATLKKILNFLFLIALLSSIIMVISFWMVDHQTFIHKFDEFMLKSNGVKDSYQNILTLASENGLRLHQSTSIIDSLYSLPIGFLIFFGFTYSVYIGGEVREPNKTQKYGILFALAFGFFISMFGMGRYYSVVGQDFNNAIPIVSSLENNPLPTGGSMIFLSGVILENSVLNIIMTFGSSLWFILLPIVMTVICIRNIFAYSMDRLLPEIFTNRFNNQPIIAALFTVLAALFILILMTYFDFPYINYITLFSVTYLVTGISGIIFQYSDKTQSFFKNAPELAKMKILKIPLSLMTIAGLITSLMFLFILYSSLTNHNFSGIKAGIIPWIVLIVVYGSGFIIYWIMKTKMKSNGIDPGQLFRKLPPE